MKKIIFPSLLCMTLSCTAFNGNAQNMKFSNISYLNNGGKNANFPTKHFIKFNNTKHNAITLADPCNGGYEQMIITLQDQLRYASTAQKPFILKRIRQIKLLLKNCPSRIEKPNTNFLSLK